MNVIASRRAIASLSIVLLLACGGAQRAASEPAAGASASCPETEARSGTTDGDGDERGAVPACPDEGLAIRLLGSGGPRIDDARASTGYVVLVDGAPVIAVDAGGGVALRMAQAGLTPAQLQGLLVSHTHVDHTADVSALLKSASFTDRSEPMVVMGPSGDERFPAIGAFLEALLGESGAWRYLGGYLNDEGQPFTLEVDEVDVSGEGHEREIGPLRVRAVGVPHGPVPALGFVVEAKGERIAVAGDQRLDDPRFAELAKEADLLIAHHAIPEGAQGVAANLHAKPSQIGAFASDAAVGGVVLSHHMARSLERLDESLAIIRERFDGAVVVGEDLDCFPAR